ncbi:hypothetical protein ACEZCY_08225 [Streptacidiphilus sp. N1-12]|uniref:DUF308 domain-containing protein n=2 Tax=Streptacidiphilus alkalitolerans TaxID=3342712 RepID=A0ABV6WB15_9ACTN
MADLPEVPEEPTKQAPEETPAEAADGPAASDDELFAQLVAGFDTPVDDEARSWPAAEDLADLAPQPRPRQAPAEPLIKLPMIQAIGPVDPRTWTPEEDPDEDHFVPPPPPPLPKTEAVTRLAITAVVGGIALILVSALGYVPALGGMGEVLGIAFFIGGAGTLFARMRDEDDEDGDDDPHRGAVV